jgi:tripartite-type tricarboxylate transporter receptor subunit TctC
MITRRKLGTIALGASALLAAPAAAQQIPTRRLIVPFPPGGAVDLVGRLIAEQLSGAAGGRLAVENIGGVGAMAGIRMVADAPKDGTVLGVAPVATLITNKYLFASMPYDPERDLTPITRVTTGTILCVVNAQKARERGWTGFRELIAWAKANPGRVNFASSGNGQTSHLMCGLLNARTGANITHVPYRGGGPAITDLLAGHVDMMFDVIPALLPHVRAGNFAALAVGSADRQPFLPDVPSMKEFADLGLGDVDIQSWFTISGPAGMPAEVVANLHRAIVAAASTPEFRDRVAPVGMLPITDPSPEALRAHIRSEDAVWRELVRVSGARVD